MSNNADNNNKEQKFENLVSRLEDIVGKLEEGQLELDESITLYEEGIKVSKACEGLLHKAEKKVEKLISIGTELKRVPIEPDADD
ncbi:MAG: exodeoxyribonuclease VII small subunit [Planctomycetes bacterium]|nr:exodeoxyribonuclease VII small subunit [Planctomycetota bacterium]